MHFHIINVSTLILFYKYFLLLYIELVKDSTTEMFYRFWSGVECNYLPLNTIPKSIGAAVKVCKNNVL